MKSKAEQFVDQVGGKPHSPLLAMVAASACNTEFNAGNTEYTFDDGSMVTVVDGELKVLRCFDPDDETYYSVICLDDDGEYVLAKRHKWACRKNAEEYLATVSIARDPLIVKCHYK